MSVKNLKSRVLYTSFSVLLLILSSTVAFAQGNILVYEFKLTNEYPESLPDHGSFLTDSAFVNPVFQILEKGIRSKVGDLPIDYYSGRQIDMISPTVNPYVDSQTQLKEHTIKFRDYYGRFKRENRKSHQYIVTVHATFIKPAIWENQENVKFKLHVKIKENGKRKIFSERERYSFIVKNHDPLIGEQPNQSFTIYQNFPLNKNEIQQAYINGLDQIFNGRETPKSQVVNRSAYEGYNDFIQQAERKYSLTVPTTYGYSTLSNVKYKVLGIQVMAGKSKYSAMVAGELSENKKGLVHMSEKGLAGSQT